MSTEAITQAILTFNHAGTIEAVQTALDEGKKVEVILKQGLIAAMDELGRKFSEGAVFVPEMLLGSLCMKAGLELLRPRMASSAAKMSGTVVLGTVAGDQHDMGKNLVSMMLEGAGFQVVDIGVNQSKENFLKAVREHNAQVVGLSSLLTTCMPAMETTARHLKENAHTVKVIVGGAVISKEFADRIGADGYGADGTEAVALARSLILD